MDDFSTRLYPSFQFLGAYKRNEIPKNPKCGEAIFDLTAGREMVFLNGKWVKIEPKLDGSVIEGSIFQAPNRRYHKPNCPCCGAPTNRGDTCEYCGCLYPLI